MDYQSKKVFKTMYLFVLFLGLLNIVLIFTWTTQYLGGFAWHYDPLHEFNYHPLFSVLGLIVLYGKGLLVYRAMRSKQKTTLKFLHSITFVLVFLFTIIALKTVFDSHDYRKIPIPHLYSLHSWVGLGTVILFGIQFLCGFLSFMYPGIKKSHRITYMPLHQFFGITIFILAVISCHSGIMEKVKGSLGKEYLNLPPAAFVANFLGITITVFAILVVYLAVMPGFKRRPLSEEKLQLELHDNIAQLP